MQEVIRYGLKNNHIKDEINNWQKNKIINDYDIKPLSLELEITNKCNQQCKHCGMAANKVIGKNSWKKDELERLIDDMNNIGIPSISFTGGEPFLEFENICQIINYRQDKIDISKLSSNGFWGNNAKEYIDKLIKSGLLNNKYFIPCLVLSIGEQKVPHEYLCNIINYVVNNTEENELHVSINHIREYGQKSLIDEFIKLYIKMYGDFPYNRVYINDYYYFDTRFMEEKVEHVYKESIKELISDKKNCFSLDYLNNVNPKILMKCSGTCYSCVCFNVSKNLRLGNYFDDGLINIIEQLNNNKYVKFIRENGIEGFKKIIPEDILKTLAENPCDACDICLDYCEKNDII